MRKQSILFCMSLVIFNFTHKTKAADLLSLSITPIKDSDPQATELTQTSLNILYLFYIGQHLDSPISYIMKTISKSETIEGEIVTNTLSFFSETRLLKNKKIKYIVEQMEKTNSINPFLAMWQEIKQFRYGINEKEKQILIDFSKLCLIVYQSTLLVLYPENSPFYTITTQNLATLEIDDVFEIMEKWSFFDFTYIPHLSTQNLAYFTEFSACLSMRYYLNRRLNCTFSLFKIFCKKKISIFKKGIEFLGLKKDELVFDDPVISGYFNLLQTEKTLDPLLQLTRKFQSFDFIKNATFMKEFLILICIAYKDLFPKHILIECTTETITEMHKLTIEQLLSIIDSVNEKHFDSHALSLKKGKPEEDPFLYIDTVPNKYLSPPHLFANHTAPHRHSDITRVPNIIYNEYGVCATTFINIVFHRSYYIKRLEKAVQILLKITKKTGSLFFLKSNLLLKPLAIAWNDFISYKDICNTNLINDFISEIFITSQVVLATSQNKYLESNVKSIEENKLFKLKNLLFKEKNTLITDFQPCIEINKVFDRFYLMKRLENVITKLNVINFKKFISINAPTTYYEMNILLKKLNIESNYMSEMVRSVYKEGSLDPFFKISEELNHYKYIEDAKVGKNFCIFITYLIHNILSYHSTIKSTIENKEKILSDKGFITLLQLQEMPLEDILNILDVLVEELPAFLEKNEIHSGMHWKEWLKKYWLIGPLRAAIFGISIYMMYKGVLAKPEHHHPAPAHPIIPKADTL